MRFKRVFFVLVFVCLMTSILLISSVFGGEFSDISSGDFSGGTFVNTTYNGTGVTLTIGSSTGYFDSRVFSPGQFSLWRNASFFIQFPKTGNIASVDSGANVWRSLDSGVTWTKINDDYNGPDYSGAKESVVNSSGSFFVIYAQKLWVSNDGGFSWNVASEDYNGGEIENSSVLALDKNNNLYVIGSNEHVWKSGDWGASWSLVNGSDINKGNGDFKGLVVNRSNVLIGVDSSSDVWKSNNFGVTWTKINDDYNSVDVNGAYDMAIDSSDRLYVLFNQSLWKSLDSGVSWNKISIDFNGLVNSNGTAITVDRLGRVYAVDQKDDLYSSSDGGANFVKIKTNYNAGDGRVRLLDVLPKSNSVAFQVRACSVVDCSDGVFVGPDGTDLSFFTNSSFVFNLNGSYFQYRAYFATDDLSVTPMLLNSSVGYSMPNVAPIVNITSPQNVSYAFTNISFNYSVSDPNGNLDRCWYSLDNGATNSTPTVCGNTFGSIVASEGNNKWDVYANDSEGLESLTSVSFFVDSVSPLLSITSPENGSNISVSNINIEYTVSDSGSGLGSCWYTQNNGLTNTTIVCDSFINLDFTDGHKSFTMYANDSAGNKNSSSVSFNVDTTGPIVVIDQPSEGQTFGSNISIPLKYKVSDAASGIGSCWYSLDLGVSNISLPSCANITFNVSGNGSYALKLYANDTLGFEGLASTSFSVNLGSPGIQIISPLNNSYFNLTFVNFLYNATENPASDLKSCELWGNFNGSYSLNQTNLSVKSGKLSAFNVTLNEGNYSWSIACNDTNGNKVFTSNRSLGIDLTQPVLSINTPVGVQNALANIPLSYSLNDASPTYCVYNVTRTSSGETEIPNKVIPNCADTKFDVVAEINYVLWMFVNDSAGNSRVVSSNFSVSVSHDNGGGNGGGGGGGGGNNQQPGSPQIRFLSLDALNVKRGRSAEANVDVLNSGTLFLNRCDLLIPDNLNGSLSASSGKSLSPGEKYSFKINISLKESIEPGPYRIGLIVNCQETSSNATLLLNIVPTDFDFRYLNYQRTSDILDVNYSLSDLGGKGGFVNVNYSVVNSQGISIVNGVERVSLGANGGIRTLHIALPKGAFGQFTIVFNVESANDSLQILQPIVLPSTGLAGFTILGQNNGAVSILLVILLAGLFGFIAYKLVMRHYRGPHYHNYPKRIKLKGYK